MMTQSIIGPNAAIRYLKAYQAHVDYWHQVNAAYLLAYVDKREHMGYIREYAAAFPDSMVVARVYHPLDGGFHLKPTGKDDNNYYVATPVNYHNDYGELGRIENVILNVMNEPNGFGGDDEINRLVRWMVDYISVATRDKTKSVLFNWADRNPRINAGMFDERFDIVLQLMAAHPELFYMGMHFYGPDNIVEHLESYIKRCERLGIVPPRVIGSEYGIDSTGGTQRGYKTWADYKDSYAKWQIGQVKGDLAPYIKRGVLIGLTTFQEGNSGGFDDFDFENDKAYKDEIKRAAQAGELEPMPKPVTKPFLTPMPKPVDATDAIRIRITNPTGINVRSGVGTDYQVSRTLSQNSEVTYYRSPFKQDSSRQVWRWIDISETEGGWVCSDALKFLDLTPPVIALPPPPVITAETTYTLTASERTAIYASMSAINKLQADITAEMLKITNILQSAQESVVTTTAKAA